MAFEIARDMRVSILLLLVLLPLSAACSNTEKPKTVGAAANPTPVAKAQCGQLKPDMTWWQRLNQPNAF